MIKIAMERSTIFKNGKPSINGPFSMAMLNNQRVNPMKSLIIYLVGGFNHLDGVRQWGWDDIPHI